MIDIYDDLDGEVSASEVIASLRERIEELEKTLIEAERDWEEERRKVRKLEALISQGFQDLKGRDVADALIDNANLSDRIKELEAKGE